MKTLKNQEIANQFNTGQKKKVFFPIFFSRKNTCSEVGEIQRGREE
jgi:hypothetical protein